MIKVYELFVSKQKNVDIISSLLRSTFCAKIGLWEMIPRGFWDLWKRRIMHQKLAGVAMSK